jgi:hypothetical protein
MSLNRKNNKRDDFIREIKKFKLRYGSVGKALSTASQELLTNSLIHDYLARDANSVEFNDNHPKLENNKEDKENSDYYEIKIYKSLTFFSHYYRHNIDNEKYYLAGSACQNFINQQSMKLNTYYEKFGICISSVVDIYNVRHVINALSYGHYSKELRNHLSQKSIKNESMRFILFPNWKDSHATVMIAIFDPANKKILATVLINSNQCQYYTESTLARFNFKDYYFYRIDSKSKKMICGFIESNLNNDPLTPSLCIRDDSNKIAYLLNEKYEHLAKLDELGREGIDLKLSINNGIDLTSYLYIDSSVPIIDASHCLQTQKEDENCSLYGLNFINAILSMLRDKEIAEHVYQLAQEFSLQNNDAELKLKNIFGHELKRFLPCYYSDMTEKSYGEIKEHHMRQRWEIGSKALATYFPVENPLIKQEMQEVAESDSIIGALRLF